MSATYSPSRPLTGAAPVSPVVNQFEAYAYNPQVQSLLQNLLTDLLAEQPGPSPLAVVEYLQQWLDQEKERIAHK